MEDSGRGWRRAVASPGPQCILESATIAGLLKTGAIVAAADGGGIPVMVRPSALLEREIGADMLIIRRPLPRLRFDSIRRIRRGSTRSRSRRRDATVPRASSVRAAWSRRSERSPISFTGQNCQLINVLMSMQWL
jgi:hypothetical protein